MGVPLEWNVFMICGVLSLFVGHAKLGLTDLKNPVLVGIFIAFIAGIVIAGNLFPRKISFLPGMRYYAGNWDTTLWCIKPSADKKIATTSSRSPACRRPSWSGTSARSRRRSGCTSDMRSAP